MQGIKTIDLQCLTSLTSIGRSFRGTSNVACLTLPPPGALTIIHPLSFTETSLLNSNNVHWNGQSCLNVVSYPQAGRTFPFGCLPTPAPTSAPTPAPTTYAPTAAPTLAPTTTPSIAPSEAPTTYVPTAAPTLAPTTTPSIAPSMAPSEVPTSAPSEAPSSSASTVAPTPVPPYVYNGTCNYYSNGEVPCCGGADAIVIDESTVEIDDFAFYRCNATNVDFSGAARLEVIGESAFSRIARLASVDMRGATQLKQVKARAFDVDSALASVALSASIVAIGDSAFQHGMLDSADTVDFNGVDCVAAMADASPSAPPFEFECSAAATPAPTEGGANAEKGGSDSIVENNFLWVALFGIAALVVFLFCCLTIAIVVSTFAHRSVKRKQSAASNGAIAGLEMTHISAMGAMFPLESAHFSPDGPHGEPSSFEPGSEHRGSLGVRTEGIEAHDAMNDTIDGTPRSTQVRALDGSIVHVSAATFGGGVDGRDVNALAFGGDVRDINHHGAHGAHISAIANAGEGREISAHGGGGGRDVHSIAFDGDVRKVDQFTGRQELSIRFVDLSEDDDPDAFGESGDHGPESEGDVLQRSNPLCTRNQESAAAPMIHLLARDHDAAQQATRRGATPTNGGDDFGRFLRDSRSRKSKRADRKQARITRQRQESEDRAAKELAEAQDEDEESEPY